MSLILIILIFINQKVTVLKKITPSNQTTDKIQITKCILYNSAIYNYKKCLEKLEWKRK